MANLFADGTYLFDVLWQSTAWLLIGLIAALALSGRPARAHGVLALAMAASVAGPLLTMGFRLADWGLLDPLAAGSAYGDGRPPATLYGGTLLAPGGLTGPQVIGLVWLAVIAAMGVRLGISVHRGLRLVAAASPCSAGLAPVAAEVARRLGMKRSPVLLACPDVVSPVIWCWGRAPRILLPVDMASSPNPERMVAIICHELAHRRRRDHLSSLLGEVVVSVLSWHPLAWYANRRLRGLAEQACDAWVLASGEEPTRYAETLLHLVAQPRGALALAAVGSCRGLVQRIRRVLEPRQSNPNPGPRWSIGVATATLSLVTVAALAHHRDLAPAPPAEPTAVTDDPEFVVLPGENPTGVEVVPPEVDLGTVAPNEVATARVWLVNISDAPRFIERVKTSCGCTVVNGFDPIVLGPAESISLEVSMTAPRRGGQRRTKYVTFEIEGQPALRLPVHLTVADPVS